MSSADQASRASTTSDPDVPAWIAALTLGSTEIVALVRAEGRPWFLSTAVERILGYPTREVLYGVSIDWVHPEDRERVGAAFARAIATGESQTLAYRMRAKTGAYVRLESTVVNCLDQKSLRSIVIHTRDVTSQTDFDRLTGLPDKPAFLQAIAHSLVRAREEKDFAFTVLSLDIDRFKMLAGSLGHNVGDQLLSSIADRLQETFRTVGTVARTRDAGFAILANDVRDEAQSQQFADRVTQLFESPFRVDGKDVAVSVSLGIATSHREYERADDLLRDAEVAATRAKERGHGKSRRAVFQTQMRLDGMQFLGLQSDLLSAVRHQQLRAHYQPIVKLPGGEIIGFEALMRWEHPARGLVSPADFIPVAEDTGLIVPMGTWILHEACGQITSWQSQFGCDPALYISVNLSPKQFVDNDLIPNLKHILNETKLPPDHLRLEVTETVGLENPEAAERTFNGIKALGVKMSLDDFGTGYSSFSHLSKFPYDTLKVDRSFVNLLGGNGAKKAEIVQSIIVLAQSLRMNVVAEGVETREQVAGLNDMHCESAQGYFFSKPLRPDMAADLLRRTRTLPPA